jgi:hypothetical protein
VLTGAPITISASPGATNATFDLLSPLFDLFSGSRDEEKAAPPPKDADQKAPEFVRRQEQMRQYKLLHEVMTNVSRTRSETAQQPTRHLP